MIDTRRPRRALPDLDPAEVIRRLETLGCEIVSAKQNWIVVRRAETLSADEPRELLRRLKADARAGDAET